MGRPSEDIKAIDASLSNVGSESQGAIQDWTNEEERRVVRKYAIELASHMF